MRRLVQATCLAAFFFLFAYVAWPYTAQPAMTWTDWLPIEVDSSSGRVAATREQPGEPVPPGIVVHALDPGTDGAASLGRFFVETSGPTELSLSPVEPLAAEQIDILSTSFGPWTLSETDPRAWPSHYARDLDAKERVAAELFLILDPLVSLSTAVAAKSWVWSLTAAGVILAICLVIPRGFCGYLCPLGTLIDLFDWAVGRRVTWFQVPGEGWWVHTKYFVLLAVLVAAIFGVLLSGFVSAIPVVTRGLAFVLSPLELGLARGWHQVPQLSAGHYVSIGLFFAVLALGLLRPRFWCKYVCPTGAVFSLGNLFRTTERKVESSCIHCRRCIEICPFDAIKPDFTTRGTDCTFCQTCAGVCPPHSIKFVGRLNQVDLKPVDDPPTGETPLGRRGFLATAAGVAAGVTGGLAGAWTTRALGASDRPLVRPPGSVPERQFLGLCIRCGECFQACPNNVLQPVSFNGGWESLWTPQVVADWSGCEPSCANCGQVCPTGAIRALALEEKRAARMGLAVVNSQTCLPFAGREECRLCVDECMTAGYSAIEFLRVGTKLDESGQPIEDSGFLAPVVLPEKCVGCGLCQTRCYAINVKSKHLLAHSAIVVEAGEGKEDRLTSGSYVALREAEARQRRARQQQTLDGDSGYLPEFLE